MNWTIINFGENKGKSIPQIIFMDGDWFFHAYENDYFKGTQANEAQKIYRRARSIRVPLRNGQKMLVQYVFHQDRKSKRLKFATMHLIPDGPDLRRPNVASSIDFYVPRSCYKFDKTGYKNFVFALKEILFGNPSHRMNRRACEDFFNDKKNFDLV